SVRVDRYSYVIQLLEESVSKTSIERLLGSTPRDGSALRTCRGRQKRKPCPEATNERRAARASLVADANRRLAVKPNIPIITKHVSTVSTVAGCWLFRDLRDRRVHDRG